MPTRNRRHVQEILERSRQKTVAARPRMALDGIVPRSMASQLGDQGRVAPPMDPLAFQGVPRYEDLGPIQREEEGRRAYERASQDYSMLPDAFGPISPIASLVADPIADAIDVGGAAFGDPASRTRTMARHERWGQGMGQVGEDIVDPRDDGNFLAQMLRDVPAGMRAEDEARAAQFLPAKTGLDRAGDVLNGLWAGWPQAGRDARGRAAESQAIADYEARDAELAGARGEITPPWAEQVARGEAERAQGDDFWINAPAALEGIPGVGLIDMAAPIARSAGRAGLRAAGQNVPEMLARPVDPLADMPMTRGYRNEGSLFRDAAQAGQNAINQTPILRDVAPYAGDWIRGTWEGRAATVPLAATGAFALSDEEDLGERLADVAAPVAAAYLGGGLAGGVARTAPRAIRDIGEGVSRATRIPERAPIDVEFSVYRPDEYTEVYVHPDGEIVAKYQGAFESGGGSPAEALRVFRGMERSLGEDIAAHQRPEYHWVPGPSRQHDPKLAEFYREAMRMRAPPGYVFSETPDGVMHLTRSETGADPVRGVNFGEQLNRDGSITPANPIESQGEPDFDLNDALGKITRNVNDDGSPYDDWIGLDGIVPDVGPTRREMLPELQRRQREIETMAAEDGVTPPTLEGIMANPTQAQWDIDQYLGGYSAAPRSGKPRVNSNMPLLGIAAPAAVGGAAAADYLDNGEIDFGGEELAAAALFVPGARGLRGGKRPPRGPHEPAQIGNDALNANPQRVGGEAGTNPQPAMRVRDGSGPIGNEAFNDPRLTPQQNRVVGMARNGMSNRQIADEELIDLAQVSVVFNGARKRAPDVEIPPAPKGNPGYNPRTGEPTATIQEIVRLRDRLVSEGYAPRVGPAGGESLYQVIGERLGISAKSVGMRLRAFDRAGRSDPLTGLAIGAGGTALAADYLDDGELDYGEELASAALLGVGARNLSRVGERVSGSTSVASGMPPGGGRTRSPAVQRLAELPSGSDFMLTGDMHWLGKTGAFERTGIGSGTDFRIARVFDDVSQAEAFAGARADEVMGVTTSPDGRTMVVLKRAEDFEDEGMATMTDVDGNTVTGSPESVGEVFDRGGINRALEAPEAPATKPARTPRRRRNDPLNGLAIGASALGGGALLFGDEAGAEEGGSLADGRRISPIPRGEDVGSGEQIGDWADVRLADGSTGRTAVFLYTGPDGSYHTRIVVARDLGRGVYDVLGSVNPEPTTDASGDRLYGSDAEQAAYDHLNEINQQGDALRGVETGGMGALPYGEPDIGALPAPVDDQTAVSGGLDALSAARFGASALVGLGTRGAMRAFRGPLRGVGADLAAGGVALGTDLALGGDPLTEAGPAGLAVTGLSSLGRLGARERGVARPTAEIERDISAPDFALRRDAFAASLDASPPVARQVEANQASVIEGPFNVEGREVPSVLASRDEVAEQGFARNRVNEPSLRERFLAAEPEEQAQWMRDQEVLNARIPRDWARPAEAPARLPDTAPRIQGATIEPLSPRSDIPPELIGAWDSALFGVGEAAAPKAPRRRSGAVREPSPTARLTRVLMDIPAQVPDGIETPAQLKRYVREALRASGMTADEITALLQKHNAKLVAALSLGGAAALGSRDPLADVGLVN